MDQSPIGCGLGIGFLYPLEMRHFCGPGPLFLDRNETHARAGGFLFHFKTHKKKRKFRSKFLKRKFWIKY